MGNAKHDTRRIGLNIMYAMILSAHDVNVQALSQALEPTGIKVVSSNFESFDSPPEDLMFWILFEWDKPILYPRWTIRGYIRVGVEDTTNLKPKFLVINSPWWAKIYYTASVWLLQTWYRFKLRQ